MVRLQFSDSGIYLIKNNQVTKWIFADKPDSLAL